ncbi:inhibitor of growth protein 1-like [Daktulosphaira vitifoliae]|uniref:inhibitor of growth protein 1-like n=1 Tax=Daktulosphaira vitifoliae TaxID=58002 RepID=UPI0021AA4F33|nr:inhibitor of growth protein 1-like [Daktulosphaira vitifoliae]
MTENIPSAAKHCLSSCMNILKKLPPEAQKHISRYYDVDFRHRQILNELTKLVKNRNHLNSYNGRIMKQILRNSLELADQKVDISEQLYYIVDDHKFKLGLHLRDLEMTQVYQCSPRKLPKRMLKWVPNYKEIDSDSIDEVLKINYSNKHCIEKEKTVKIKNCQNPEINNNSNEIIPAIDSGVTETIHSPSTIKKKKKKSMKNNKGKRKISESSGSESEIQPTYCICEQISFGHMVCCDNDLCPIEWFHFSCVSLNKKPKGKWYCPKCRGSNSKMMKSRKLFFKELEEYNKRKEEDW